MTQSCNTVGVKYGRQPIRDNDGTAVLHQRAGNFILQQYFRVFQNRAGRDQTLFLRDRIYSLPEMSEEDGMRVAELEVQFAELDGYSAVSRAGEILLEAGIEESLHFGLMKQVAPGWKLRVPLAQALFADPDILLLDDPTNHLDMESIEALNKALPQYECTLIFVSHHRQFVSSLATRTLEIKDNKLIDFLGTYDEYLADKARAEFRAA